MTDSALPTTKKITAYFTLSITVLGTIFNSLTFIVLCRSTFRNTKTRPALHYMRLMAIFDILILYGWNLDNYFAPIHGFTIVTQTLQSCRFLSFFNYFALQTSAWLRVFVSLDRYLSLSRLHKTWFSHSKHVLMIIGCIMICCIALNSIFFVYGCSYNADGTVSTFSWPFQIYPLWSYINLGVYNCAPFILMALFNSGVIYHLIRLRRTTTVQNSQIQHRSISITLMVTTFAFLIMTTPSTIAYAFFWSPDSIALDLFNNVLYLYYILSFPLYVITFDEFRREFIAMIRCKNSNRIVRPIADTVADTANLQK